MLKANYDAKDAYDQNPSDFQSVERAFQSVQAAFEVAKQEYESKVAGSDDGLSGGKRSGWSNAELPSRTQCYRQLKRSMIWISSIS